MKLTAKQKRFVDEYLIDLNATQAAIRAGYSARWITTNVTKLLENTSIQAQIAERQKQLSQKLEITQERVLKERARLAFFDVRKLFGEDGRPLPISELDDDSAAAISGIKVVTVGNDDIGIGQITEYKLSDKSNSLTALEKHLGLYEADNKQKDGGLAERLEQAIARVKSDQYD